MIDRFKRFIKYRVVPLFLVICLFGIQLPKAAAADSEDVSLRMSWSIGRTGSGTSNTQDKFVESPFYGNNNIFASLTYPSWPSNYVIEGIGADITMLELQSDVWLSGAVGVYCSLYFDAPGTVLTRGWRRSGAVELYYINNLGQEGVGSVSYETFKPVGWDASKGYGLTIKATTIAETYAPISCVGFRDTNPSSNLLLADIDGTKPTSVDLYIPSLTVIAAPTSGDLAALEGIADGIAAQSQIMSAMYGDIMSVLNNMYSRLGDMQAVQETANGYFQTMITLLESLNSTNTNIYSLLQAQFAVLKAVIETESGDIQAAIAKQTQDLIAYFDEVMGGSVGSLPDDSASADDVITQGDEYEQQYHSDALERFNALSASFNGFSGDIGSGVAVAGTLFSRVWAALGNYVIVYTFPLLLGLALVIIGRLGRGMVKRSSGDHDRDP